MRRSWIEAGLPPGGYEALTHELPPSRLWSLLVDVAEARAERRQPTDLVEQWERDRFVQPSIVDQRTIVEVDGHLLRAASAFESIELSPVAPLGVCAIMGHASQNKVLSALRGTEVISDPTNVMALESARRLRRCAAAVVRFQISARSNEGAQVPLIDGGAFDWVARLTSNRRAVFVASGLGLQLVPLLFRRNGPAIPLESDRPVPE